MQTDKIKRAQMQIQAEALGPDAIALLRELLEDAGRNVRPRVRILARARELVAAVDIAGAA